MRSILALLSLAVFATLAWGGYWFVGARALDRSVAQALQDNGQFDAADHRVRGFPNRFDLTLDQPRLTAPGLAWQAPFVQVFALTYRPHHVIVVFANDQRFDLGGETALLHSADLRASVVAAPRLSLALERSALVAELPEVSVAGQTHRADALRLASRALAPERHEMVIEIENGFPDAGLMNALDPGAHWPRRFDVLRLEGEALFDRPLDREALQGRTPALAGLALTGGRIAWREGDVTIDLRATGRLEADSAGRLSGPLTLEVTQWRALMRRARDAGMMPADHAQLAEMALESMVDPENPDQLEVALQLRGGDILLGPVVLGSLPPLF